MGTIIRNVKHQKENRKHQSPQTNTNSSDGFFSKSMRGTSAKKTLFLRALVGTLALKRPRVFVFAMNGGADVCKSLVKGPAPSTQLHDMAEPWPRAPQRRAAWPTLAELAGSSAAGASGPRQLRRKAPPLP